MRKILSLLKGKAKYILGIAFIGAMLSILISPVLSSQADGPQFNFMEKDYELFRGANITKNENVWKDPVAGEAGDTMNAMVYYHNGKVDTIAQNTRISVTIPAETTNGSAKLTASIMADNAATVNNTILVNGQFVGARGLTFNLDKDATLALVPESVKWYPNNYDGQQPNEPLLFGQDGSEIKTANGLKIGDIQGCFPFAGFVTFRVKTTPKVTPPAEKNITIAKSVRNVTKGESAFSKSVNASRGDKVEFKVVAKRISGDIDIATVSDQLPAGLTAVSGSAKLTKAGSTTSINEASFLSTGINVGPLSTAISEATVTFSATVSDSINTATTFTNWVTLVSCGKTQKDSASVVVNPGNAIINKSKSAFNITQNIDATKVSANAGDEIKYTLVTSNTGTRTVTFTIDDGISDILEYADVIEISNHGVQINGPVAVGNDRQMIRYPAVEFAPGQSVNRTFTVKVKNPIPTNPANGFSFDHKMFNVYGNEVVVLILNPICPKPALTIDKTVRNVTKNETVFVKSNTAFPGDTLEYKIDFANEGNASQSNVRVFDALPTNVTFDQTSPIVANIDGTEKTIAGDVTKGFNIDNLAASQKGYIKFRVVISGNIASGEKLVNTGFLATKCKTISSTAETVILVKVVQATTTPTSTSLPKTGAAAGGIVSLFGALFAGVNMTYLKQKKLLSKASRISAN